MRNCAIPLRSGLFGLSRKVVRYSFSVPLDLFFGSILKYNSYTLYYGDHVARYLHFTSWFFSF